MDQHQTTGLDRPLTRLIKPQTPMQSGNVGAATVLCSQVYSVMSAAAGFMGHA